MTHTAHQNNTCLFKNASFTASHSHIWGRIGIRVRVLTYVTMLSRSYNATRTPKMGQTLLEKPVDDTLTFSLVIYIHVT